MFSSVAALKSFLEKTQGIPQDRIETVDLDSTSRVTERMLVDKENPSVPVGFVTVTYQGIVPGRGKVWNVDARPA